MFEPKNRRRPWRAVALCTALCLVIAACGSDDDDDSADDTSGDSSSESAENTVELSETQVRVAAIDSWTQTMIFRVAQDQGFFEDEGLDVSYTGIAAGPDQVAAIIGGSIDVSMPSAPAILGAITEGDAEIKAFSATRIGGDYQFAISREFADEHGIDDDTPADEVVPLMEGARFASASQAGIITTLTKLVLDTYGVDPDADVELQYNDAPAAILANFEQGRADAFIFPSDLTSLAKERKDAVVFDLADLSETPDLALNPAEMMITSTSFADEHADTLTAFLRGMWHGWQYLSENEDDVRTYMEGLFPEMPAGSFQALYDNFKDGGFYLSEASYDAALRIVNAGRPDEPYTLTYDDVVVTGIQDDAIADLDFDVPTNE